MSSAIITPNLCVFCYKSVPPEYYNSQNREKVNYFCATLNRLQSSNNSETVFSSSFGSCKDCEEIITQFSDLYHQIKCLELHLFWKLENLRKVMNFADKLQSRVANMKKSFETEESDSVPNYRPFKTDLEAFKVFRSKIKKKCNDGRSLSRCQPRVSLKQLDQDAKLSMETNVDADTKPDEFPLSVITAIDTVNSSEEGNTEDPLPAHLLVDDNTQDTQEDDPLNIDGTQMTITTDQTEYNLKTEKLESGNWIEDEHDFEDTYSNSCTSPLASNMKHDPNDSNEISDAGQIYNIRQRKDIHQNIRDEQISWGSSSEAGDTVDHHDVPFGNKTKKLKFCKMANCMKRFKTRIDLKMHEKLDHHNNRPKAGSSTDHRQPFNCEKCGKSFKKQELLRKHLEYHKSPKEWKYKCEICAKKSPHKQNLTKHMLTHSDEKPFKCDQCGKGFKMKEVLKNHLEYHKNPEDWKYECSHCGKKCANKQNLTKHLKVHSEDKPWKCEQCPRAFKLKEMLKKHSEFHKNPEDRKFQCAPCGRKFASKQNLISHIRTHTGEKPFECKYCGEKFGCRDTWKNHLTTKHGQEDDQL